MKMKTTYYSLMLLGLISFLASCTKDADKAASTTANTTAATTAGTILATAVASTGSVAIAAVSTTGTTDSLYLVGCLGKQSTIDTAAFSALPAAIGTYLAANYSGYTFVRAYNIKNTLSAVTNYVVAITYNGNYVGLNFNADGTFVNVLEQRIGDDLRQNRSYKQGGLFNYRNGLNKDTISLSAIPTAVSTFFTATYPTDTLLHAFVTLDTTYVLISKNNGLFGTSVTAAGSLVSRLQIAAYRGKTAAVTAAALPASATAYLTTTYPGYVFGKAFSTSNTAGTLQRYYVFITVNSTRYVVAFSATGIFVAAKTIR
ncbi:hypothetical protein [Mucilaginibacter phyllosphaerae]|uniref:Uncharacterized protein n=1 Tax=Mucilaginibacter phyllosphaerae TaxID=1812349 RepID=A0A4Y8A9U4_9SPHI|nr:hypothetical protein [Mucilaginibacter phyllosphaerae]MBB3969823.1 hypothetical protein [Mucilaginibacter phyllosphaerae]TEW65198.1 hypothetical protein E2R65_14900 [Mucilaginibacter phyllosphaerae]GGH17325.1 hypothetical protein GCM10007352_27380 [Mucilaginibacter phyllosphaerae]